MAVVVSFDTIEQLDLLAKMEDRIVYCFDQWLEAGKSAVLGLDEPDSSDSFLDFAISLFGNLAWAATVFFAPEMILVEGALVASASRSAKAVSVLGAIAGSGTVGKLRHLGQMDGKLNSKEGKRVLHEILSAPVPGLQKIFVDDSADWAKTRLPDLVIAALQDNKILTAGAENNKQLMDFYTRQRPQFDHLIRRIVWEHYVFPDKDLTFDKGQYGLEEVLSVELEGMVDAFDRQWDDYKSRHLPEIYAVRGAPLPSFLYREKHFAELELAKDPFLPKFKLKRIPAKLQFAGDANREKLLRLVHAAA